jgi:methyl-accepting chemotaxis protein
LISDTVQSDKSFSQVKQAFYTQADLYAAANTTGSGQVASADIDITENIEDNNSFTQETIKQITDITNLIKGLTQKYLGNMKKMVDTSSGALQEIPRYLTELQNAIQTTTSNSLLSKYTAPLEKLYQSLSDMNDDTGNSGN